MGYDERMQVLNDDEEWYNIPVIVRSVLSKMNDDVENTRRTLESLRVEQKETNALIRRLIQKQTEMDIDATKNMLSNTRHEQDTKLQDSMNHMRKRIEKVNDKLKTVEEKMTSFETISSTIPSLLTDLTDRVNDTENKTRTQHQSMLKVKDDILDNSSQIQSSIREEILSLRDVINLHEKKIDNVSCQVENMFASSEASMDKKYEAINKVCTSQEKKLKGVVRNMDKLEALCEKHVASTEEKLRSQDAKLFEQLDQHRAANQDAYAEVRRMLVDAIKQCQLSGELHEDTLDRTSKRYAEKVSDLAEQLENTKSLGDQRWHSMERKMESMLASQEKHVTEEVLNESARTTSVLTELKLQAEKGDAHIRRLEALVSEMSTTHQREKESVRDELNAVKISLQDENHRRACGDDRVSQLLDTVQRLSIEIESLEKGHSRACNELAQISSNKSIETLSNNLKAYKEETSRAIDAVSTTMEDTSARSEQTQQALEQIMQRLDARVKTEAPAMPHWAEKPLQELAPALVEVDAIKRRLAAVEMTVEQSGAANDKSVYRQRESLADVQEESRQRHLDLSKRLLMLEKSIAPIESNVDRMAAQVKECSRSRDVVSQEVGVLAQRVTSLEEGKRTLVDPSFEAKLASIAFCTEDLEDKLHHLQNDFSDMAKKVAQTPHDPSTSNTVTDEIGAVKELVNHLQDTVKGHDNRISSIVSNTSAEAAALRTLLEERCNSKQLVGDGGNGERQVPIAIDDILPALEVVFDTRYAKQQSVEVLQESVTHLQSRADECSGVIESERKASKDVAAACEAQILQIREEMERSANEDSRQIPSEQFVTELIHTQCKAAVENALHRLQEPLQELSNQLAAIDVTEELMETKAQVAELLQLRVSGELQKTHPSQFPSSSPPSITKEYLDERLDNVWRSVASLVARKDDQESVNKKLDCLHTLLTDELNAQLLRVHNDVINTISEKVSLAELQQILESNAEDTNV